MCNPSINYNVMKALLLNSCENIHKHTSEPFQISFLPVFFVCFVPCRLIKRVNGGGGIAVSVSTWGVLTGVRSV